MERVDADAEMEGVLARGLGNVLVGADTAGFEGFRRKLLVFVRDEMNAEWEVVNRGTLAAKVVNADLISKGQHGNETPGFGGIIPSDPVHLGCSETLGMACSCNSDSSEQVDVPSFIY